MDLNVEKLLDGAGRMILRLLQEDARLSFSELGRRVGLSQPAAAERVKRMEAAGLITGYHAAVDAGKLGLPITAFIRLAAPAEKYPRFLAFAEQSAEILECHHVSGGDSFVMKAAVSSTAHLERLIGELSRFGQTNTAIVLSSPIGRRAIDS